MNPQLIQAWRSRSWAVLSGGDGPSFAEAASILQNGLSALGLDIKRADEDGQGGERAAIILNASGHGSSGYAFRLSPDRMEFHGDSEKALPLAAAAFLEALGGKALAPRRMERVRQSVAGENFLLSSAPLFSRLTLLLREAPAEADRERWKDWALSRGFGEIALPSREFGLSGGIAALEAAPSESEWTARIACPAAIMDLNAEESAARARALFAAINGRAHAKELRLVARAGGASGFVDAYLRTAKIGEALPRLVIDDGERCRAHPLGDPKCERNASIFGAGLDDALARWKASGGEAALRLRYDDDLLFPVPATPQTAPIARDLAWAAQRGLDGIEYALSSRLPERPSLNAWIFSALAFPPPRPGPAKARVRATAETLQAEADAARQEFFMISSETEKTPNGAQPSQAAMAEFYACLEEAWAAALDRGLDEKAAECESLAPFGPISGDAKALLKNPPAWPLDPWNEGQARQEERASALSEAYGKLDRCVELLCDIPKSETTAFHAQESAIELAGVMRALYSESKKSNSISGLAMMADGASVLLGRKLAELYRPGEMPEAARRFVSAAYRFRIAGLYRRCANGLIGALRAAIFRIGLRIHFR